jgi:hypothetical protein
VTTQTADTIQNKNTEKRGLKKMAVDQRPKQQQKELVCTPRRTRTESELVPTTFTTKAQVAEHHNEDKCLSATTLKQKQENLRTFVALRA